MGNLLKGFREKTVLGRTSAEVLQTYLEEAGLSGLLGLPPLPEYRQQCKTKTQYIEGLMARMETLIPHDLATLTNALLRVYMLTRDKGRAMLQFLHLHRLQHAAELSCLDEYSQLYDKAFILYLRFRQRVDDYYLVYVSEHQNKRFWNRRRDYVPPDAGALTAADLHQLIGEVKNYLQSEKRGHCCEDRCFELDGKTYVFLMTDDQPIVERAWQGNKIDDLSYIPVFQIAIVYDPGVGEVDICCENTTTRLNIHRAFAKAKFQLDEISDRAPHDTVYDLRHAISLLLTRHRLDLRIPHGSAIEDIFIKAVRLRVQRLGGAEILLDSKRRERNTGDTTGPDAVYMCLRSFLRLDEASPNSIFLEDATPTWMEWMVAHRDPYDPNRIIREPFTISGRNTCNLDLDGTHGEIRACLEQNGIIRHKSPAAAPTHAQANELPVL